VLDSEAADFTGCQLAVGCDNAECGGERVCAVAALASLHGPNLTIASLLNRMRCRSCGKRLQAAAIETGRALAELGWMQRLALAGAHEGKRVERYGAAD